MVQNQQSLPQRDPTNYITKKALLGEVVELYPEAVPVIQEYGLHCVGCFASSFDTIEAGCRVHGMDDAIIDELVEKVNGIIHQARQNNVPNATFNQPASVSFPT